MYVIVNLTHRVTKKIHVNLVKSTKITFRMSATKINGKKGSFIKGRHVRKTYTFAEIVPKST